MNVIFKSCTICNSSDIPFLKRFDKQFLVECQKCHFVFDKRIPTISELNEHYKVYAYSSLKPVPPQTVVSYNKLLDVFEKYKESGNILDIGCGQGDFLVEAKKRGWNVYGSEFSESAVKLCKGRDINMHKGELTLNEFKDISFDVVTSFEVIEHINNPNDFMNTAFEKMRVGGLYYCTTPNFNSILRNFEKENFKIIVYPEHISFYTKASIKYLGGLHNFKAIKIVTTGLDLSRMINSFKGKSAQTTMTQQRNATENIRNLTGSNSFARFLKGLINLFLSITGKGDTLKVYWIKK